MPLPFLIPLLAAGVGAGLGALKDKKKPWRGALIGGGLGGLGGGLGAGMMGAKAAGLAGASAGHSVGGAAAGATAAGAKGLGLGSLASKGMMLAPLLGQMGGQPDPGPELPPLFMGGQNIQAMPLDMSMQPQMPVQMSYNQPHIPRHYG